MAALACAGCRSPRVAPGTRVVEVTDVHRTMSADLQRGTFAPLVLHVPAGTRMALDARAETPFLHTEPGASPPHLVFDREVWIYLGDPMQFSYDGTTWQPIGDVGKGKLSFGVAQSSPVGPPTASVALVVK
jgi:hypothetical protein